MSGEYSRLESSLEKHPNHPLNYTSLARFLDRMVLQERILTRASGTGRLLERFLARFLEYFAGTLLTCVLERIVEGLSSEGSGRKCSHSYPKTVVQRSLVRNTLCITVGA